MSVHYVIDDTVDTPYISENSVYVNANYIMDLYKRDPNTVVRFVAHISMQNILGFIRPEFDRLMQLAEDMITEYVLDSFDTPHISLPGKGDRMYACERLFKRISNPIPSLLVTELKNLPSWETDNYIRMFTKDDHSRRTCIDEESWSEISKQVMTEVEGFSKNIDEKTDSLLKILRIRNRRHYDYRTFLKKFLSKRTNVKENPDEFDYIYYSYGLRLYGNVPLIDSLEYSESNSPNEFVIAIDTSGSTVKGPVSRFIEESLSVIEQGGMESGKTRLHIIQCDDRIRSDTIIRTKSDISHFMNNFELKGGKGTDFRPVFRYIDSLIEQKILNKLNGMIYFTDGLGTFPEKKPEYDVAFVFCDDEFREHIIPPWAMKIIVQTSDLIQ